MVEGGSYKTGSVNQATRMPLKKGRTVQWITVSGNRLVSIGGRWRLARKPTAGGWTLTDRRSGYRRHFLTAREAQAFVHTAVSRVVSTHGSARTRED